MDLIESAKQGQNSESRHPWELARLDVVTDLLKGIIPEKGGIHVLDVGCGDIFMVKELAKRFPEVHFHAIDTAFTQEMISALQKSVGNLKIRLYPDLESVAGHCPGASIVLLLDVIEHVEDDVGILNGLRISGLLLSGARLLITVPAFNSLFCSHDRFLLHYRRYTNKTLRYAIQKAGLVPERIGYFFSSLLVPRMVQVAKERMLGGGNETTGLVEWKGSGTTSRILNFILLSDYRFSRLIRRFTGIKLPGLSNYAICRLPA